MNDVSKETFRGFLDRLRTAGELVDIRQPVDIRHIATLVYQAETALHFHDVIGYGMPVVSGLIRTRERAIMSMGCTSYGEIEEKLQRGIDRPVAPKYVETASHKEVIQAGDEVDLFSLPVPMSSIYDGGPMITAGVTIARDPEYGINSGIYRFMVKEKNLTGIDMSPRTTCASSRSAPTRPAARARSRSRSARIRSRSWARAFGRRSAWTRWR